MAYRILILQECFMPLQSTAERKKQVLSPVFFFQLQLLDFI